MRLKPKLTGCIEPDNVTIQAMHLLYEKGDAEGAYRLLEGRSDPLHVLRQMTVPRTYRTQEEVTLWRSRWEASARKLKNLSDKGLWQAASLHDTFELAYQQENDRELMSLYGDALTGASRRLFPDLHEEVKVSGSLKIGIASVHLKSHNGALWALGWLDGFDCEKHVIHFGGDYDQVSKRFADKADHAHHLPIAPQDAARYVKKLGLDILIHTDIGMSGKSAQMATFRMAPIQCTAWGHPVTSGMPNIDFYLSSELMEPDDGQDWYSEELFRLPGSGLNYISPLDEPSGADLGLPDKYLVLAQNVMKVLPRDDAVLLETQRVTGLPIVAFAAVHGSERLITKERWEKVGLNVIWLPYLSRADYLQVLKGAQVSLDTFGWSGGNTTIDALRLGTPVVNTPGKSMRARHGLCFLKQAGLEQFLTQDYPRKVKESVGERVKVDVSAFLDDRPAKEIQFALYQRGIDNPCRKNQKAN